MLVCCFLDLSNPLKQKFLVQKGRSWSIHSILKQKTGTASFSCPVCICSSSGSVGGFLLRSPQTDHRQITVCIGGCRWIPSCCWPWSVFLDFGKGKQAFPTVSVERLSPFLSAAPLVPLFSRLRSGGILCFFGVTSSPLLSCSFSWSFF